MLKEMKPPGSNRKVPCLPREEADRGMRESGPRFESEPPKA
jgi:hypothetical protein